jgi:hypothetical protein
VTTERRLSEASPAELFEAALAACGWSAGEWTIELRAVDGTLRKIDATNSSGRHALLGRREADVDSRAT